MLYIISKPFCLLAGNYSCKQIDADAVAVLIKKAHAASELRSFVHFASTVSVIKALVSLDIGLGDKEELPPPADGDCFIDVRLKPGTPKGRPVDLADLDFWRVDYIAASYDKIKEPAEWPAILH